MTFMHVFFALGQLAFNLLTRYVCGLFGIPPGRACSEDFGESTFLATTPSLTGNRAENLRAVGIKVIVK